MCSFGISLSERYGEKHTHLIVHIQVIVDEDQGLHVLDQLQGDVEGDGDQVVVQDNEGHEDLAKVVRAPVLIPEVPVVVLCICVWVRVRMCVFL